MNTINFKDDLFHVVMILCSLVTCCLMFYFVIKLKNNNKNLFIESFIFSVIIIVTTHVLSHFIGNIISSILAVIICLLYIQRVNFK